MSNFYLPSGYQFENYIIESVLGSGGFGITYLARDISLDTKFAIKEYIPSEFAYREDNYFVAPKTDKDKDNFEWGLSSFLKEARTLVRFNDSENIVKVYRFFEANGTAYFVMEYIQGETLTDLLKANQLSPQNIEKMFSGILNGLKRIHKSDVLHKDIKPSNIMIKGSTPILIDFGSARENKPGTEHTRIITERYSPIEQYDPAQQVGFWSDIYSMSATFYRAITGSAPPEASGRVIDDKCIILSNDRPEGFSKEFLNMIDYGLRLLPKDRPQNIEEWEKYNKPKNKLNFSLNRTKNIGYRFFQGGFAVSAVIAFFAIINITFPDRNILRLTENKNDIKGQIISGSDSANNSENIYERITKPKPQPQPIKRDIIVYGYQWKSVNLKKIFDPALLNGRSTKGYIEIESEFPIRFRSINSRKFSNPHLFKKGGKVMLEDIGFLEGNRTIELKSINDKDNISLIYNAK